MSVDFGSWGVTIMITLIVIAWIWGLWRWLEEPKPYVDPLVPPDDPLSPR